MSSSRATTRIVTGLAALAVALTGLVVVATPAQADDKLVKVTPWCNQTVTFYNVTSKKVHVEYEAGAPISPFPAKDGTFMLKPYRSRTLVLPGGKYHYEEAYTHRLYWEAERGDDDQDGYVKQWRNCKGLVSTQVWCEHVKFKNLTSYKLRISYRDGSDYYYWDDDFSLKAFKSKTKEFESRTLKFLAEKIHGKYKQQYGTVYMPKKCDEYDDDDDDDFDPDFWGDFILRLIPGFG